MMSPAYATLMVSRSRPKKRYARDARIGLPTRLFWTAMSFVNRPEHTRTNAMPRIHVRLDLEHEAGEPFLGRRDRAFVARTRLRRRGELDERPQERLEAEIRERAAEEHRCLAAGAVGGGIVRGAGAADDVEVLAEMRVHVLADEIPGGRVVERRDVDRS